MLVVLYLLLLLVTHISFFYVLFRLDFRKKNFKPIIGISFVISTVIVIFLSTFISKNAEIMFIVPCLLGCYFFINVSFFSVIKYWLIAFPGISIIESALNYGLSVFFNFEVETGNVIGILIILLALWLYYIFIGKKLPVDIFRIEGKLWIFIAIALFVLVAMLSYFRFVLTGITGNDYSSIGGLLLISVGSFVIFAAIFLIVFLSNLKNKYEIENVVLGEFNEQQKAHFERLLDREKKTKKFRHDISADIAQVHSYLERNKYDEAKQYLCEMEDAVSRIKKESFTVGNEVIDTLLNFYLQPYIGKCKIQVIGVVNNELKVSKRDLSIIISNVLKNAAEAVESLPVNKRIIVFEANQGRFFLSINVKNTYSSRPLKNDKVNTFDTTKNNTKEHGIGLINVNDAIKRNGGAIEFHIDDKFFITDITLKIDCK